MYRRRFCYTNGRSEINIPTLLKTIDSPNTKYPLFLSLSLKNMFPFTTSQWQELEHQALVFKYMISGLQIPQDLLFTITTSLHSSLSSKLLHHPPPPQHMIGWNGYQYEQQMGYGHRKIDPEPGRCRRTDGKKWRCSKEAYPDSKYCERHMHRGRNRSRKPVENITLSSKPPTNIINNNSTAIPTTNNYSSPSSSAQSHFLYPHNTPSSSSRPGATKFFMESNPYRNRNRRETDEHPFFSSGINSSSNGVNESASWQLSQMKQNSAYNSSGLESWQQQLQSLTRQQNHYDGCNNNNNNYSSGNNHVRRPLSNDDRDEEDNHQPKKVMHHFLDSWPDSEHHQLSNNNKTHLSASAPNSLHDFFMTEKW